MSSSKCTTLGETEIFGTETAIAFFCRSRNIFKSKKVYWFKSIAEYLIPESLEYLIVFAVLLNASLKPATAL